MVCDGWPLGSLALLAWTGGPLLVTLAVDFMAALGPSCAISRWILARHSRAFVAVIPALYVFCLAVRP